MVIPLESFQIWWDGYSTVYVSVYEWFIVFEKNMSSAGRHDVFCMSFRSCCSNLLYPYWFVSHYNYGFVCFYLLFFQFIHHYSVSCCFLYLGATYQFIQQMFIKCFYVPGPVLVARDISREHKTKMPRLFGRDRQGR